MKKSIFSAKPAYRHLFKMKSFHNEMADKMTQQRAKIEEYKKQKSAEEAEKQKYDQEIKMKQDEMRMKQEEMAYKHNLLK